MKFDDETRRKLNMEMAVALIRDLFQKGQISKRTYDAIEKDAKTKIAGSNMSGCSSGSRSGGRKDFKCR